MKAAKMPIHVTTAEIADLETLLGQYRYYSGLLASSPLLTAESLTVFISAMPPKPENDEDEVEDDENENEDEDEDDDEGHLSLPDLDDTERKQLDATVRGILNRRIAKMRIELTKYGVNISDTAAAA